MIESTMAVNVAGKVEQRRIDYVQAECSIIGGNASRPPIPYPVHADDEIVIQTVSGETFILKN